LVPGLEGMRIEVMEDGTLECTSPLIVPLNAVLSLDGGTVDAVTAGISVAGELEGNGVVLGAIHLDGGVVSPGLSADLSPHL
jgi:hypothetical protein